MLSPSYWEEHTCPEGLGEGMSQYTTGNETTSDSILDFPFLEDVLADRSL